MSRIFSVTLEGTPSTSVEELFEEVEKIDSIYSPSFIKIDMNGIVYNVKIYETKEQVLETYWGILNGNKQRIIAFLPQEGDAYEIGASLELINTEFEKFGFEKFSNEEIEEVVKTYQVKKLKRSL